MRFLPAVLMAGALAACSPPPLPAPQTAQGTTQATIQLPPQGAALKAHVHGMSKAVVKEGGWVELRLYANDHECMKDEVVRQGAMGPNFTVGLACDLTVPKNQAFTFHAEQEGRDAETSEVKLEVRYER